jgi:lysophospholipase L1-like esterase
MYFQGKRIKASVPRLPEAKGIEGYCSNGKSGNTLTVLSIGESTIAGVGVETHEEGFTGAFAKELAQLLDVGVRWKVYARSGYTASRVAEKLIPKITETQADLIVIGLGGNDAFTLNRPSRWKAEIRWLIESLQAKFPEATIVFCHMPPIKEFPAFTPLIKFTVGNLVEILGEELRKVVSDYQRVIYLGEKLTLQNWMDKFDLDAKKEDFFSDGVHPSKLTYQTWAKDIARGVYAHDELRY